MSRRRATVEDMTGMTGHSPAHGGRGDGQVAASGRPPGRRAAAPPGAPGVPGYLVSELIRAGGRATVWAGTRADGLDVALKVVPGGAVDAQARQEAEVLQALDLDHVVHLHDVIDVGGDLVLVLDLLRGGSLADVVSARGHLSPGECVTVLTPLLTALGRLHRAGVTHADISPGNILFDLQGRPHLGDLGEAVLAGHPVDDSGATLGFVAPEVLLGERPGPAADVYAIGAVGRFCLEGTPPPSALADTTAMPSGADPAQVVLLLCHQAMTEDPDARPDADSLAMALYEAADAEPLHLVSALDPTADVTRRLRELVGALDAGTPGGERVSSRRRPGRRPRRAADATGPALVSRRIGSATTWRRVTGRAALGSAVLAGIVVLVIALAGNPSVAQADATSARHGGSPRPSLSTGSPSPTASPTSPGRGTSPTAGQPVDLMAAVAGLAATRARLWADPTVGDLASLDVPDSAAWAQDLADRTARADAGTRLDGLAFEVVSAQLEGAGPVPPKQVGDQVTVRVVLRTSTYTERAAAGTRAVPSSVADPVLLDLALTADGWRIESVRAVP